MGKATGFIEFKRDKQPYRPVAGRLGDWKQQMLPWPTEKLQKQGARCMDCGIPFCHQGCPLGNLIPDWNDLVYRNKWGEASEGRGPGRPRRRRGGPGWPPFDAQPCAPSITAFSQGIPSSSARFIASSARL